MRISLIMSLRIPISNFGTLQKQEWMVHNGSIKYICTMDSVPVFFQHNNDAEEIVRIHNENLLAGITDEQYNTALDAAHS